MSQALTQSPQNRDMRQARANVRFKLKNFQGVVEDSSVVIKTFPAGTPTINRKAYLTRAKAYTELHQLDKARQDYLDMLRLNGNYRMMQ